MPDIHFDRFYRYEDLTRLVHAYAEEFPNLVQVDSIGHSHEGRDIWLVTITNTATGPASAAGIARESITALTTRPEPVVSIARLKTATLLK